MGESFNEDDYVPVDSIFSLPARRFGGPVSRLVDAWWWVRRAARETHRAPPWRRARWLIQRARRGWADPDVWNLHNYIRRVIGGMVLQLRDRGCSWPGGDLRTPAEWAAILTRIAEPLLLDWDRDVDGETTEQRTARQVSEQQAQQAALRLMTDWFNHLWD